MVDQKTKLKQQEAAPKHAVRTRIAAPKCTTEKKFRHLCWTKVLTYNNLKSNRRKNDR